MICPLGHARNIDKSNANFNTYLAVYRSQLKRSKSKSQSEVEGKFRNLNFSPSTKKTTEYSFELFLSIYRY